MKRGIFHFCLESQLQPHFLFNTLNAVSSKMYQDPARADLMLGRLSDLLRLTFARSPEPKVRLATELEWLEWYLDIMQLRFGDRLSVRREVDPAALSLAVPRLLLQPLVENALKHGAARRAGAAELRIVARVEGESLRLLVERRWPRRTRSRRRARPGGRSLQHPGAAPHALWRAGTAGQ